MNKYSHSFQSCLLIKFPIIVFHNRNCQIKLGTIPFTIFPLPLNFPSLSLSPFLMEHQMPESIREQPFSQHIDD